MKKKKWGKICIVLVFIVFLGVGLYFLIANKYIVIDLEPKEKEEKQKVVKKKDNGLNIPVDNAQIIALFEQVHAIDINNTGGDSTIYQNKDLPVEGMEDNYKFLLAYNLFKNEINSYQQRIDLPIEEVSEEDVKNSFEKIFGPNTYQAISKIDMGCGSFKYNSTKEVYQRNVGNCESISTEFSKERIIFPKKYSDRIEINSAVVFGKIKNDKRVLYRDYEKTDVLEETELTTTTIDNSELDNYLIDYIDKNQKDLRQYTYIFKLAEDGFYYYQGAKQIQ